MVISILEKEETIMFIPLPTWEKAKVKTNKQINKKLKLFGKVLLYAFLTMPVIKALDRNLYLEDELRFIEIRNVSIG